MSVTGFTRSELRDQFRMKPKRDAQPMRTYKNCFGVECKIYALADCESMRPLRNKPRAAVQETVAVRFTAGARLESGKGRAGKLLTHRMSGYAMCDVVVFDTETTGLDDDQIIEIGFIY